MLPHPLVKVDAMQRMAAKIMPRNLSWMKAEAVSQEICSLVEHDRWSSLTLDFANVEFLSAVMLGRLVAIHGRLRGKIKLRNVRPHLFEIFTTTRLTAVFDVREKPDGRDFPCARSVRFCDLPDSGAA